MCKAARGLHRKDSSAGHADSGKHPLGAESRPAACLYKRERGRERKKKHFKSFPLVFKAIHILLRKGLMRTLHPSGNLDSEAV